MSFRYMSAWLPRYSPMIAEHLEPSAIPGAVASDGLALEVPVGYDAVRQALHDWRRWIESMNASSDLVSRAEIVLAEVLNNITEHGYAGQDGAAVPVALRCRISAQGLHVSVVDQGRPAPADLGRKACLPPASPAANGIDSLPEGGFGWFLIRELTCNLHLESDEDGNRLCFVVPAS